MSFWYFRVDIWYFDIWKDIYPMSDIHDFRKSWYFWWLSTGFYQQPYLAQVLGVPNGSANHGPAIPQEVCTVTSSFLWWMASPFWRSERRKLWAMCCSAVRWHKKTVGRCGLNVETVGSFIGGRLILKPGIQDDSRFKAKVDLRWFQTTTWTIY